MPTALTPTQIIADLRALDRIENDWSAEGRLDGLTKDSLDDKRADLMDELRTRFTTSVDEGSPFKEKWSAWQGDMDCDHNGHTFVPTIPVAYGKTELEAIETLLEMIGEDA
jgi:hypothetical protein